RADAVGREMPEGFRLNQSRPDAQPGGEQADHGWRLAGRLAGQVCTSAMSLLQNRCAVRICERRSRPKPRRLGKKRQSDSSLQALHRKAVHGLTMARVRARCPFTTLLHPFREMLTIFFNQ